MHNQVDNKVHSVKAALRSVVAIAFHPAAVIVKEYNKQRERRFAGLRVKAILFLFTYTCQATSYALERGESAAIFAHRKSH